MEIDELIPPRSFEVGRERINISHVADIRLATDEQITFRSESGTEYDVVRKSWGYYATPSLAARLPGHGLRPALTRNIESGNFFVVLVEKGHEVNWLDYCAQEGQELVSWLDSSINLSRLSSSR